MNNGKTRAVILLNGEPYRGEIPADGAYVICCDGAYSWAKGRVRIDENLGDFDSLDVTPIPPPLHTFPSEKDETDGELAVDRALSLGARSIAIYGGGGGREDHFLGNLHLLYKALAGGAASACLIGNGARLFLYGKGRQEFSCKRGQTVSLLPFGGDAHIMKLDGVKYSAGDLWLRYGSTRGISNLAAGGGELSFLVKKGYVLVIINEEVV